MLYRAGWAVPTKEEKILDTGYKRNFEQLRSTLLLQLFVVAAVAVAAAAAVVVVKFSKNE